MNENNVEEHKLRARIVAKGFVQGVGYRNFVMRIARKMHILGETRNLPNGDVEIFCKCKNSEHLIKFIEKINVKKPDDIYSPTVESIEKHTDLKHIDKHDPPEEYRIFKIDYGDIPDRDGEMLIKMDTGSRIMQNMHQDMITRFDRIDEKYDSIGEKLEGMLDIFKVLVESYTGRQVSKKTKK